MREPRYPLLRVVICFGAALSRRRGFSSECGLGVGETGSGQDGDASSHAAPTPREGAPEVCVWSGGAPRSLVPTRRPVGQTSVFQRSSSPGGGLQEDGTFGSLWGVLIDSMILPQVHLRNGENSAGVLNPSHRWAARLYLKLRIGRATHHHSVCELHP